MSDANSHWPSPPISKSGSDSVNYPLDWSASEFRPAAHSATPFNVRRLGDYELLAEIGRGGMGMVYKARQVSLNRTVAVKVILAGKFAQESEIKRFRAEAEAAANLQHPNIVTIYEVGEHEGHQYYSMDLVEGESLAAVLEKRKLTLRQGVELMIQIARAVHYAHQRGIIHRDLKPSNILMDGHGRPKVVDFGLAKQLEGGREQTMSGVVLGTPAYMSPEQAAGKPRQITTATDVYSLGVILYQMMTGRLPFSEESSYATLKAVIEKTPTHPSQWKPGLDLDLETICMKCLLKDPEQRYSSAEALAEDLERWLNHEPIAARPASAYRRARMWARRRPVAFVLAVLCLLCFLGLGVMIVVALKQANEAKAQAAKAEALQREAQAQSGLAEEHRKLAERERAKVQHALAWASEQHGYALLELNQSHAGMAYLAKVLTANPTNRNVAARLYSAMMTRIFCRQVVPSFAKDKKVQDMNFSPDARYLYTRDDKNMVQVWDVKEAKPVWPDELKATPETSIQFSTDSLALFLLHAGKGWERREIATGLKQSGSGGVPDVPGYQPPEPARWKLSRPDKKSLMVQAVDGSLAEPFLIKHTNDLISYALSPDGNTIATSHADYFIRMWGVKQRAMIAFPIEVYRGARDLQFSHDGRWLAVGSDGYYAQILNAHTGTPVTDRLGLPGRVLLVRFSADDKWMAVFTEYKGVWVYAVDDAPPLYTPIVHGAKVTWTQFSADGRWLVTAGVDGVARIWDMNDRLAEAGKTIPHESAIVQALFSPDSRWLATGAEDGSVRIWEAATGKPVGNPMATTGRVTTMAFSPNSQRLAVGDHQGTVQTWDIVSGKPVSAALVQESKINSVHFSPNSQWVVVGCEDGKARVYDVASGKPVGPWLSHSGPVHSVVFDPEGRKVGSAADLESRGIQVSVWDAISGNKLDGDGTHPGQSEPRIKGSIQFSSDGQTYYFAMSFLVRWRDIDKHKVLGNLPTGFHPIFRLSADEQWLITLDRQGNIQLWDVKTGVKLTEPLKHPGPIMYADLSPDARWLITVGNDDTARLWELYPGRPGQPLPYLGPLAEALTRTKREETGVGTFHQDTVELIAAISQNIVWDNTAQKIADWFMATGTNRTFTPLSPKRR